MESILVRLFNDALDYNVVDTPCFAQFASPSIPSVGDKIDVANGRWLVVGREWRAECLGEGAHARLCYVDVNCQLIDAPERGVWEGSRMEVHLPSPAEIVGE